MSRTFAISRFRNARDRYPRPETLDWQGLCKLLTVHAERGEKDGPLWSPACYPPNATRAMANVLRVSCAVADVDSGAPFDEAAALLSDWAYIAHSSYSHTEQHPKYRVVLPLRADISNADWGRLWPRLRLLFAFGSIKLDTACCDSSRIYYLPACPAGAPRWATVHIGKPLEPADLPNPPPPVKRVYIGDVPEAGADQERLLTEARARASRDGRNAAGFWLACQLRDNRFDQASAEGIVLGFASEVASMGSHPYTEAEARGSVRQAYRQAAREPWHASAVRRETIGN